MTVPVSSPIDLDRPVTMTLAEIAHVLVAADGTEERLARAVDLLGRIVRYEQCALVEMDPEGEAHVRLFPDASPAEALAAQPALLRLLGLVSDGMWQGTLGDVTGSTERDIWGSYLAVPLIGSDGVDGLLLVGQRIADAYDEDDLRLLSIFASQIAAYLATCRLRAREARLAEERVAHLEALRASDERLHVGLAHAPIVVFQQDLQLRYTWFDKLLPGWTSESILRKTDHNLFPPDVSEPLEALKRRVLETGQGTREEVRAPALDGKGLAYYDLTIEPLRDDGGDVVGITCAAVDVTQRRAVEQLHRELIAMVTHDLRTPLTAIRGRAELLRRRAAYDEQMVGAILAQTGVLERLIGDLADFSRVETGQLDLRPRRVDLVTIARESIAQAQARSSLHELRLVAPPVVFGIWDSERIFQIFQNLLANALKYAPSGGEILIRIESTDDGAEVSIRDDGVGVAAESLPHLFDRFYRAQSTAGEARGLGLGLAIVRGLVEAHGGRIRVESDGPGRGATVTFTLPFDHAAQRTAQAGKLTKRQLEVAQLIASGQSNAQIARALVLTAGTVANHIEHILRRLNMSNRAQVAAWIVEHGLLDRGQRT